jgi:putative ABC transport system permease protein
MRSAALRLAIAILNRDRRRTTTALLGVAISYFLMVFQGGLFTGFLSASAIVVRSAGAELWISARDTPCIEFGSALRDAVADEVRGIHGVESVARAVAGFAPFKGADGRARSVALIGIDPLPGARLPQIALPDSDIAMPEAVVVDRSAMKNLGITGFPAQIEIANRRAELVSSARGFGTFLGAPYAFASYGDARSWIGLDDRSTMFVLVKLAPGSAVTDVRHRIQERYPELQVLSADAFAQRSGSFWMGETGAGGGIAMAGLLGLFVGVLIVSQIMYAMTSERLGEFATLLALGAPQRFATRIVIRQALLISLAGCVLGALLLWPISAIARAYVVAWLLVPWWLPLLCVGLVVAVAQLGARSSLRLIRGVDPVTVFRS